MLCLNVLMVHVLRVMMCRRSAAHALVFWIPAQLLSYTHAKRRDCRYLRIYFGTIVEIHPILYYM